MERAAAVSWEMAGSLGWAAVRAARSQVGCWVDCQREMASAEGFVGAGALRGWPWLGGWL